MQEKSLKPGTGKKNDNYGKNKIKKSSKMKHPLAHPKKALVYTQILLSPEPITAKQISTNTGLPLNTVYNYIRELARENIIQSQSEIIQHIIQENWFINTDYIEKEKKSVQKVLNEKYEDYFYSNPIEFRHNLMMLYSMATPYIKTYEENKEMFTSNQEHSSKPAVIKTWILFPEEFEHVVKEIEKIRKHLRARDMEIRDQQDAPTKYFSLKGEENLVFIIALPKITDKKNSSGE